MREILFRAKTASTNPEWVEGYYTFDGTHWIDYKLSIERYEYDWVSSPINPNTLGQFTGIKDKNGVKIFEGDIVIAPFLVPKMTLKLVANMEWNNRWWSFADKLNNYCEIIGNFYDNPELLEQEENK